MYTVGSIERAGSPRRAAVAAGLALIVVTALAATLTARRQQVSLGPRVAPPSWPVSFQVPPGWELLASDADQVEYRHRQEPKGLIVRRLPKPSEWSAERLAAHVMTEHMLRVAASSGLIPFPPSDYAPEPAPLGPLPGVRIDLPETGDYVHVGLLPDLDETAVVVQYHTAGPFSERDVQLSRMVAASVESTPRDRGI